MDNGYIRMWSDLKYVCQYPDPWSIQCLQFIIMVLFLTSN